LGADELLLSHNYVLLETTALAQRRLGLEAVRALRDELVPVLAIEWVEPSRHAEALAALVAAARREVSLVDHVSFELMRRRNVRRALAVDRHFAEQGFALVP
jgi:uncharacterized protein